MKTNLNFTKGEWVAAMTLLAVTLASYLFYYMYDDRRKTPFDPTELAATFTNFEIEQKRLSDSAAATRASTHLSNRHFEGRDTQPRKGKQRLYDIVKIDVNNCDSTDLTIVPGFGSKRAARLVEYRNKLGGFHSLSQLREVYVLKDMDEDIWNTYLTVTPNKIRKININTATYQEMIRHPYFDAYLTKTILNYRQKNGVITSLEEFQRITHAYPELIEKLKPYLEF